MKIAACFANDSTDCSAAVEHMALAMRHSAEDTAGFFAVPGGAVGYTTGNERHSSISLLRQDGNGNSLLVSGVPICSWASCSAAGPSRRSFGRARVNAAGAWFRYHRRRLDRVPVVVGPLLGESGLVPRDEREHNPMLDAVVRKIDPGHPDLSADAVRSLQKAQAPHSWPERLGRRLRFHWHVWRWVMAGQLTAQGAAVFVARELAFGGEIH
ncbi:MAG: hypothetical protein P1P84_12340 [Deferrisomatales bacterium]|nr:hypothetical protein [Deferrisomatales bacterium]